MQKKSKIRISLFSGGSGNDRFINLIKNIPGVEIDIIVNGYDDGKSTGEIRKFIPGILGPSDFRKNFSHLINSKTTNGKIFKDFFIDIGSQYHLTKAEKKIRINGLRMFSDLVSKTGDVEGSYFKILKRLKKDDLPTIDTVIPPMNIGLENIKEAFTKDPINGFNNLRQQIVEIYKQDKDLTTFKHDLAQLDVLEDLMELRKSFVPEGQDQITFMTKTD